MNIADIIAEFGAYYLNSGQNMSRLIKLLNRASTTDSVLTPVFTDETIWRAAQATIGRILQPFQKTWTPIENSKFTPVEIRLFNLKADTELFPDDIVATWLGFLSGDGIDRKTWPLIRYYVEELLLPQIKEDYEMNEVYYGVRVEPANGVPGAAGSAINGLRKILNDHITAGRIDPIVLGAIPADPRDFVEYVEQFADRIDKRYWKIAMQFCFNEDLERKYLRGVEQKYGRNTVNSEIGNKVRYTNFTVIGLPSMQGSDKIWCTPKGNAIKLGKKTQNQKAVQVENVDRKVKIYTDFWSGVGVVIPEIVFTNDLDLI